MTQITVVIPAHDPDPGRLGRTLAGLRAQSLAANEWETVLVDNASRRLPDAAFFRQHGPANFSVIREERLGLTHARRAGLQSGAGAFLVLVDDDNVLAEDYLEQTARLFAAHPEIGALGGRSLPEFERQPEPWQREFLPLLALRDGGDRPCISKGLRPDGGTRNEYPVDAAPIGAGMALRREAARAWLRDGSSEELPDRRGSDLTSGGDNDIVLALMKHGWEVGYFPELKLTHLIPAQRLDPAYLARLNRGIQRSWLQVLLRHDASPWPPIPGWTAPLRKAKAWFTNRAWSGPAGFVRWQGACGHFEGRVRR